MRLDRHVIMRQHIPRDARTGSEEGEIMNRRLQKGWSGSGVPTVGQRILCLQALMIIIIVIFVGKSCRKR